jgi:hypothetical protein
MDFLLHGSHLFKAFVGEKSCPSSIGYGIIVSKRRPEYCLRTTCRSPRIKELKLLQLMKEKEKEKESLERKIQGEDQLKFKNRRRRIFQRSSASIVIHLVTILLSVLRRKGRQINMHQQSMLMSIHHRRRQRNLSLMRF